MSFEILTPKGVEEVVFTSRISWNGKHGYDEDEVDDFLDDVTDTLVYYQRLMAELQQLVEDSSTYERLQFIDRVRSVVERGHR